MHDFIVRHYEHGVRSFRPRLIAPLGHAAKVLPKRSLPHFCRRWIVHQFFVTRYCPAGDRVHHRVGVVFKIDGDFGMLDELARGVNGAERCRFLDGE